VPAYEGNRPMHKTKILVVDDEEDIQDLCKLILTQAGYQVDAASDGINALSKIQEGEFDLLLLDIMMPRMGGLDLLRNFREMSIDIPTVVLTSFGSMENTIASLRLGVKDFLVKPFVKEELLDVVNGAIEGGRRARENIRLQILLPLFEVSRELLVETDLRRLLKKILDVATKETRADQASIMLIDPESRKVTVQEEAGPCCKDLRDQLLTRVMDLGHPIVLAEPVVHLDKDIGRLMKQNEISALISMPLVSRNKTIGLLNVCKGKGMTFNESDLEMTSIFCGQAAIAIENAQLFEEVNRKTKEIQAAHFGSIQALAEALESKDAYTRGHSDRALEYAVAVGERIGVPPERMEYLKYAAILHDIGKIGIPDAILNKPTKLTADEYQVMKSHPEKGAEIIRQIKYLDPVVPLVLYHQERYDGLGYPAGLKGDDIPIESRIVAVLDAYDAMTTDRIYRKAPGREQAILELKRNAGTQFDPKVVEAFLSVLAEMK
jgi:putative nucleotidyltransferase with HDIG domain